MEGGRGISGGQKQLIGMTRIVLAPAAIILLDEPTAAMDSVTEAKVVALLKGMAAKGATLIVATHKTALLPVLDRLWVIKDRQVILDGARDQVLARMSGNSSGKAAP
jgi:ATP-binding cassette subfamily C protein LapB